MGRGIDIILSLNIQCIHSLIVVEITITNFYSMQPDSKILSEGSHFTIYEILVTEYTKKDKH
jgi:hypothetical protein